MTVPAFGAAGLPRHFGTNYVNGDSSSNSRKFSDMNLTEQGILSPSFHVKTTREDRSPSYKVLSTVIPADVDEQTFHLARLCQ